MELSEKLLLIAGAIFYFAPTIVALKLHLKESWNIFFVNVVFGWTIIGWLIAAGWAIAEIYETAENPLPLRKMILNFARNAWLAVRARSRNLTGTLHRS
jgi:positive regulator of sigma E activity